MNFRNVEVKVKCTFNFEDHRVSTEYPGMVYIWVPLELSTIGKEPEKNGPKTVYDGGAMMAVVWTGWANEYPLLFIYGFSPEPFATRTISLDDEALTTNSDWVGTSDFTYVDF